MLRSPAFGSHFVCGDKKVGDLLPRAKNAKTADALQLYRQGHSLKEIADLLQVPESTVRSWKNRGKWECNECNGTNATEKTVANVANRKPRRERQKKEPVAVEVQVVCENPELTEKQRLFCTYYVRSFNATKSYMKAYGCDYWTAATNAGRLLKKAEIVQTINELKQAKMTRELLKEEDIFQKYLDIAFNDITDYLDVIQDDEGQVIRIRDLDEVDGTLINEIAPTQYGYKIKLPDRQKALDWLADHMDLATEEQKARIQALKQKSSGDPAEPEDDGFLDALNRSTASDWDDYED